MVKSATCSKGSLRQNSLLFEQENTGCRVQQTTGHHRQPGKADALEPGGEGLPSSFTDTILASLTDKTLVKKQHLKGPISVFLKQARKDELRQ